MSRTRYVWRVRVYRGDLKQIIGFAFDRLPDYVRLNPAIPALPGTFSNKKSATEQARRFFELDRATWEWRGLYDRYQRKFVDDGPRLMFAVEREWREKDRSFARYENEYGVMQPPHNIIPLHRKKTA